MFPTGAPASVRASFSSDGNTPPQNGKTPCTLQEAFALRDSVLHAAGGFPAPGFHPARCRKLSSSAGFRPARCRKLSSSGIPSCTLQEAFQLRDSVLHAAGSFPAPGFRPARCRKLSCFGKSTSANGLSKTAPFPSKNRPAHRPQMPIFAQKQTVTSERP